MREGDYEAQETVRKATASVCFNIYLFIYLWSRGSSVGIATRYGLDGPGIECRCGRNFPHKSRTALRPTQWVPGFFPWVKRPEGGVALTTHPI
jgi:hypothetical protein